MLLTLVNYEQSAYRATVLSDGKRVARFPHSNWVQSTNSKGKSNVTLIDDEVVAIGPLRKVALLHNAKTQRCRCRSAL